MAACSVIVWSSWSARRPVALAAMEWLSVPFAERELAAELSLRYGVAAVPTVVVVDIDADGRSATVRSTEGRMEVLYAVHEGRRPGWLSPAANPPPAGAGKAGDDDGAGAGGKGAPSLWRRIAG